MSHVDLGFYPLCRTLWVLSFQIFMASNYVRFSHTIFVEFFTSFCLFFPSETDYLVVGPPRLTLCLLCYSLVFVSFTTLCKIFSPFSCSFSLEKYSISGPCFHFQQHVSPVILSSLLSSLSLESESLSPLKSPHRSALGAPRDPQHPLLYVQAVSV